jgi:predicted nucleic acid-binding protein
MWGVGEAGAQSGREAGEQEGSGGGYVGPALVATDLCFDLAQGMEAARAFFTAGRVETRLATATYLELLAAARSDRERRRIQAFVAAYPVLNLGPVASARSVELLLERAEAGLTPLQALTAATALAHEIPLFTRGPEPYRGIDGLQVLVPY